MGSPTAGAYARSAMEPHRPAHRRETAQVYRLRRAIAASVGVLVIFGLLNVTGVVGGDGDEQAAGPTTTSETTTTTIPPPPACAEADVVVPEDPAAEWATILIDTARMLPPSFGPPDLHNIADAGFPFTDGVAVRQLVLEDLSALREAAAANGTPLSVIAGYRSYQRQADLYERRVDELGDSEAGSRVARPGPLRAPARHDDRRHDRGRDRRRPVVGRHAQRPVGRHQRPRVRLPPQLPARCLGAHLLRLRAVAPPLRRARPGRRGHRQRPEPAGVPVAAQPSRHHRDHHEHDDRRRRRRHRAGLGGGVGAEASAGAPTPRGAASPTPSDEQSATAEGRHRSAPRSSPQASDEDHSRV